jgi:hypothetical protein
MNLGIGIMGTKLTGVTFRSYAMTLIATWQVDNDVSGWNPQDTGSDGASFCESGGKYI